MRNTILVVVLLLLLSWLFPIVAGAEENWPKVKAALANWDGVHQITLRTELSDPFGRHEVQDLLEAFIDLGYVVTPAKLGSSVDQGLALDMRDSRNGMVLILSRGSDGAVIAIDRLPETAIAAPASTAKEQSAVQEDITQQPAVEPIPEASPKTETTRPRRYTSRTGSAANLRSGSIELEGQPRQILLLGQKRDGSLELALQSDAAIAFYRLAGSGLQKTGEFKPPLSNNRALSADAGDLDGNGSPEIAAVWGEDIRSIYEGTDTQLHSWILDPAEAFKPLSSDLEGYLRIVKKQGYLQYREQFEPFSENIYPLVMQNEQYGAAAEPTAWGQRNLYEATPLNATSMIAWDDENRLQLISREKGEPAPGSTLMKDLGAFRGPEVAVRLKEPEYRSGFGKEDKIYEHYHSLGRRVAFDSEDRLYTIDRERSTGSIPLFQKSTGKDTLVKLTRDGQGLVMDYVFDGIDAYILDFALLEEADQPIQALLLLNDKEDGSGQAYLLKVQSE